MRVAAWVARILGALVLLIAFVFWPASPRPVGAVAQVSDDPDRLVELVQRLLANQNQGYRAGATLHLVPGRLATEVPIDLPTPAGGRLWGSLVTSSGISGTSIDIVMEAPGSADEVLAFFEQAMIRQGWNAPPPGAPGVFGPGSSPLGGGFQSPESAARPGPRSATFCPEPNAAYLTVSIYPRDGAPNDARIRVQLPQVEGLDGYGACATRPNFPPPPSGVLPPGPGNMAPGPNLIPRLTVPAGVSFEQPGAGGTTTSMVGIGSYATNATVITDLTTADLEAYFAEQLRVAGWVRGTGDTSEYLSWSIWQLPEQEVWQGTLLVLAEPGRATRMLMLRVDSLTMPGGADVLADPTNPGEATVIVDPVSDSALLQELAARLLMAAYGNLTMTVRPTLLVGETPQDLRLPMPRDARLVGSLTRSGDTSGFAEGNTVVLDAPGSSRDLLAFYAAILPEAGWRLPPYSRFAGNAAFVSATAQLSVTGCDEATGQHLTVTIQPRAAGPSDVRLTTQLGTTPCWPPSTGEPRFRDAAAPIAIPALIADPGVVVQPGTQMVGSSAYSSSAMLISDVVTPQLEATFREQLRDAGWIQTTGATSAQLAWSMWDVPGDESWRGLLLTFDLPGDNRHAAILRADPASSGSPLDR